MKYMKLECVRKYVWPVWLYIFLTVRLDCMFSDFDLFISLRSEKQVPDWPSGADQ